jgi:glucosylceramidase
MVIPVMWSPRHRVLLAGIGILAIGCGRGGSSVAPPPVQAATPALWPVAGSYSPTQSVTLSDTTPGAAIHYTTDGSTPSVSSPTYSEPLSVSATTTVQAIAVASGYSNSAVASASYTIIPQPVTGPPVSVVLTTDDQAHLMAPQSSFTLGTQAASPTTIFVDENQSYQEVEGFGAAFTDSACYLLNQISTSSARSAAMNDLFTRNGSGIGLSFMRNPIGASDIARTQYSFDDLPANTTDANLSDFSIAHDQADIIPLILQARSLNPDLKLMATPWSPPGWMKSTGSLIGGTLLPAMYTPYANYFVKYLHAYAAAGVTVDYLSLQNEPLNIPSDYPGMGMDATTQTSLLKDYLLPAFAGGNVQTRILVYDHNWDQPVYPQAVFADPALLASTHIAGTAWHGYGGTPGAMNTLENLFPGKANYQTEHSGGTWVSDQVRSDFEEITHVLRNGGRAYVKWSLALNENRGPHTGGCGTCSGIVTVNSSTGAITYGTEFYTLGHYSKFILPGAVRIFSSNAGGIVSAAFLNPDGSKALIVYNDSSAVKSFAVQWGSMAFTYTLPAYAAATFSWTGSQTGSFVIPATNQIQASSYTSALGLQTEQTSDTNGGYDLGYATDGGYAVYNNVDFSSGVSNVNVRVACAPGSGACSGTLEFHLDSATGPLFASLLVPSTGGWQNWTTATANVSAVSHTHNLYVVFTGSSSIANLNWFQFH